MAGWWGNHRTHCGIFQRAMMTPEGNCLRGIFFGDEPSTMASYTQVLGNPNSFDGNTEHICFEMETMEKSPCSAGENHVRFSSARVLGLVNGWFFVNAILGLQKIASFWGRPLESGVQILGFHHFPSGMRTPGAGIFPCRWSRQDHAGGNGTPRGLRHVRATRYRHVFSTRYTVDIDISDVG